MKIYVGNLPFEASDESLRTLFSQHGEVDEVAVITDRETGRPHDFAFVTMPNDEEARAAIDAVDGRDLDGRTLKVDEARPRERGGGGHR